MLRGWFLFLLFFFPSSANPLQNPFQTHLRNALVSVFKEDQKATNSSAVGDGLSKIRFEEEVIRVRRLRGHAGGHGVGGHSGGDQNGGGHGGGGLMSHQNNVKNNGGANSCTTNHNNVFVHVVFVVLPFLFLT